MRTLCLFLGLSALTGCRSHVEPTVVASVPKPGPSPTVQPASFVMPPPILTPTSAPLSAEPVATLEEIRKIEASDPIANLEKAWQQGDHRFAVIKGAGMYVPGVKIEITAALLNQYGAKVVCAPGDTNMTDDRMKLYRAGVRYATSYNRALLKKINAG